MILSFHPCYAADAQIILGDRQLNQDDLSLIAAAEAILLPQGCTIALHLACKACPGFVFPNYDMRFQYPGKTGQSLLFEKMGWPHPVTTRWDSVNAFRDLLRHSGRLPHEIPFFLKRDYSHEGAGAYLIREATQIESVLGEIQRCGESGFTSQAYIPCEGNVLRVVILGKKVLSYWKRPERADESVISIGRNAWIDKEWRPDLQEKGIAEARRFGEGSGINLAAMDFVFSLADPDPVPLILEINYYFGRRGLGGSLRYYRLLFDAIHEWLTEKGVDTTPLSLV
jgi:ribosomal protein S6--L-glutamate ligase